jgi:glycine hydroxymethyltransferase
MAIRTTAHIARSATASSPRTGFATVGAELLAEEDPLLHGALCAEHSRQESMLSLLPDTAPADPSVLSCLASVTRDPGEPPGWRTATESLALRRACAAFGAGYANVRASSHRAALHGVLTALAGPEGRVLDLRDGTGFPEPDAAPPVAVVLAVATGQDLAELRAATDACGALLVVDATPVAGEVVTGGRPSPVDAAHVTVVGTRGQLAGPDGAVVLCDTADLAGLLDRELSWEWPGAGSLASVAGVARTLDLVCSDAYRDAMTRTLANAGHLADELARLGYRCERDTGGGHVVRIDLSTWDTRARFAAPAMEEVNIVVETTPSRAGANWLRLGTGSLTQRQFGLGEIRQTAELVHTVLGAIRPEDDTFQLEEFARASAHDAVLRLVSQFPVPRYVPVSRWAGGHA